MRTSVLTWGAILLSAVPSIAHSQNTDSAAAPADPHAAQPERPTVATHAGTVAPGWVEIEAGVERDHLDGAHVALTPTVLKFGVAPRVQIELIGSFQHLSGTLPDYSGIGDIGAALKWRALEHAPVLGDFSLQPSLKLPTGSSVHGTGTGTTDIGLLLISSHDWGGYALDINAGYTRRSGDAGRAPKDATLWTVSSGGPVYRKLGWVAEFYGFPRTTGPAGEAGIVAFLTGPTVEIEKWLVLDAGAIFPLAGAQPHALYAGLTWNFGKL
ncbi:MAG TPA: transporter [Gemmatimonadaceae bacterium]